jgi:hypothetical protein
MAATSATPSEEREMSFLYQSLGMDKRISEIVFAGSHDAAITGGSSSAQTQFFNIGVQAASGVRLFDLRILARKVGSGATMVGYHGIKTGKGESTYSNTVTKDVHDVKTNSGILGEFGLPLKDMLKQGKEFVTATGEFLIFKFDKCTNYKLIADYCVEILGTAIFGKLTLGDLSGKVVCVFSDSALPEMKPYKEADGILGFKSLRGEKNSVGTYDSNYLGLQYYGKGGTSAGAIYKTKTMKMNENVSKQRKMLMAMAERQEEWAADVLGMMYWTATGSLSSIRKRNENVMWGRTGVDRMGELWREGLEASVAQQLAQDKVKVLEHGGIRRVKAYFPNIIMIDFADLNKCKTIFALNKAVDDRLAKAYDDYTAA